MSKKAPNIVVIGGGTGNFTLLNGLKHHVQDLTAIVNMSDDGGSTGILRDELGVLPPGDVRQCLVALSDSPHVRDLFNYRFPDGPLAGHTFGNLFLSAVEKMTNSFEKGIELANEFLHTQGKVIPVTLDLHTLVMVTEDGSRTEGQHIIGHAKFGSGLRPTIKLEQSAHLNPAAKKAIKAADLVVIAPGNLYASIAPALLVDGMKEALKSTKAKIVYVSNLVTKPGQTDDFKVHDFADEIERFIGAPVLDYVIFNTDQPPPTLLEIYTHDGEYIVEFDLQKMDEKHYHAVGVPLIAKDPVRVKPNDPIARTRSLIRHNQDDIAREIMKLYFT